MGWAELAGQLQLLGIQFPHLFATSFRIRPVARKAVRQTRRLDRWGPAPSWKLSREAEQEASNPSGTDSTLRPKRLNRPIPDFLSYGAQDGRKAADITHSLNQSRRGGSREAPALEEARMSYQTCAPLNLVAPL